MLGDVDVVGVRDIVAVSDARHHAETLLQALGELVGRGFQRCAVQAEINIVLVLPLGAGVVHMLHHVQRKGLGGGVGVALAGHILAALIQARIAQADGGIAAVEQLVDGLAPSSGGPVRRIATGWARRRSGCLSGGYGGTSGLVAQPKRSSNSCQNLSKSPPLDRATSTRLMVTTP